MERQGRKTRTGGCCVPACRTPSRRPSVRSLSHGTLGRERFRACPPETSRPPSLPPPSRSHRRLSRRARGRFPRVPPKACSHRPGESLSHGARPPIGLRQVSSERSSLRSCLRQELTLRPSGTRRYRRSHCRTDSRPASPTGLPCPSPRQHFLCFLPLPHGHGALRATFFAIAASGSVLVRGRGYHSAPGPVGSQVLRSSPLKVTFRNAEGAQDSVAWLVRDLQGWRATLEG